MGIRSWECTSNLASMSINLLGRWKGLSLPWWTTPSWFQACLVLGISWGFRMYFTRFYLVFAIILCNIAWLYYTILYCYILLLCDWIWSIILQVSSSPSFLVLVRFSTAVLPSKQQKHAKPLRSLDSLDRRCRWNRWHQYYCIWAGLRYHWRSCEEGPKDQTVKSSE